MATGAVGCCAALVFTWVGVPLPWMTGPMLATGVLAMVGAPVTVPRWLRNALIMVLGVLLGSAITPSLLVGIERWVPSVAGLATVVLASTAGGYAFLRRFGRLDRATAYFAAAPGGLSEMVLAGERFGGDQRAVALIHTMRLALIVLLVPLAARVFGVDAIDHPAGMAFSVTVGASSARDQLLLAASAIGAPVALAVRVPAAWIVGPMLVSAGLHLSGVVTTAPPAWTVAAAQVVVGAYIGCRFAGTRWREAGRLIGVAAPLSLLLFAVAAAGALVVHGVTGWPIIDLLLAYVPGGFAETGLVALAIGADAAFVACHHLLRVLVIIVCAPPLFGLLFGSSRTPSQRPVREEPTAGD